MLACCFVRVWADGSRALASMFCADTIAHAGEVSVLNALAQTKLTAVERRARQFRSKGQRYIIIYESYVCAYVMLVLWYISPSRSM